MMDYYSQFSMPTIEERKQYLLEYANTLEITKVYDKKLLNEIITKIVAETHNFSFTGYSVFGKKEEQTKLYNILHKSNDTNETIHSGNTINTINTFK